MGQELSHISASERLEAELGIEGPFYIPSAGHADQSMQRIVCLIQQEWLLKQINAKCVSPQSSTSSKQLSSEEKADLLQPSHDHELNGWQRVSAIIIRKPLKKLRISKGGTHCNENYSLFDFLKQTATKDKSDDEEFMNARFGNREAPKTANCECLSEETLRVLIQESSGIAIKDIVIDVSSHSIISSSEKEEVRKSVHRLAAPKQLHFVPLLLACQSETFLYFLEATPSYTLHDVLAFSPAIVSNSAAKYMFLFYQILRIFSAFEAHGLKLSSAISFKDFYVTNSMWISVSRFTIDESDIDSSEPSIQSTVMGSWLLEVPRLLTPPFLCLEKLQEYTTQWVNCELSTFDYLMILNTLAGRRMKDPSHYPVFPWVVDFTKADGGYRDFTKSKYRLCKSDAQLDITYNQPASLIKDVTGSVPHHISHDPLTAITYYVYVSRRISKETLCKHVRSRWVPDEYPSSMERLYAWTPEECIPEFYSDPMIFQSIHSDLHDLKIPSWTETPEDFVKYHRSVLESHFVSHRLNDWIDLVFGYKLSGMASIDSKNVYLSLVDGHSQLTNCGVLQLFSRPHPTRRVQNLNEEVVFAKSCDYTENIDDSSAFVHNDIDEPGADDITCVNGKLVEESVHTHRPAAIRRDLWSIDSAIDEASQIDEPYRVVDTEAETRNKPSITLLPSGLRMRIDTLLEVTGNDIKVPIADDLIINSDGCSNFVVDLEAIERELKFQCNIAPADSYGVNRYEFGSIFDSKKQENKKSNSDLDFPGNRGTLTLVNILIELTLHEYVRLRTRKLTMVERLNENGLLMRAHLHRFPSWMLAILESWLRPVDKLSQDEVDEDIIVNRFLRHPELLLCQHSNPFPYPKYFPSLHNLLVTLFDCTELLCESSASMGKDSLSVFFSGSPIPSISNIARTAHLLPNLIEELDREGIYLLLSFLLPLFADPVIKLYAFLHFFHPLGIVMGFHSSLKYFFVELQKLYGDANEHSPFEKKLLDRSFISKIITVFGLNCFLECFVQYVIDGLIEISDSEYSKEKNGNDNFEAEINEFQSEKPSAVYLENASEGMNEMKKGQKSLEMEIQTPDSDSIHNHKTITSFIDDEGNVDVLDPKPLVAKRLGESGVFTRLESIVEDGKYIRISDSDDSDQDIQQSGHNVKQNISQNVHGLYSVSEDDLGAVFEEENDSKKPKVCKVLDKSEVIYHDSVGVSIESTVILHHEKSHPLDNEKADTSCIRSESGSGDVSTVISQSPVSYFSTSAGSSENFTKVRRSTLSESIQNNAINDSVKDRMSNSTSYEKEDRSSFDVNCQCSSNDDDLAVAIEEFSIDSMCSESDGRSFLIRRSDVKVRGESGSSPFMVLDSDADVSDEEHATEKSIEDNAIDEYTDLQVDSIPGGEELDSIAKGGISDDTMETDSSAEELALDSLKWIVPWLGPVLTSKYIMSFILKRAPKIWLTVKYLELNTADLIAAFKNKGKFLMDCLMVVVGIYGTAVVCYQFIPFSSRVVSTALKASTVSTYVEGQLVSSIHILSRTLVYLTSDILAEKMEILSQDIFEPSLRLLSSSKSFSSGSQVRSVLLYSLVDLLATLSQKLGQLDARDAMTPLLQRFFSCFDCVYRLERKHGSYSAVLRKHSFFVDDYQTEDYFDSLEDSVTLDDDTQLNSSTGDSSSTIGPRANGSCEIEEQRQASLSRATCSEALHENVTEREIRENGRHMVTSDVNGISIHRPESNVNADVTEADVGRDLESVRNGNENSKQMSEKTLLEMNQYKDLCNSFTPHLAHYSYVLFCRVLGDHFVSSIIYNEALIWQLCSNFDEGLTLAGNTDTIVADEAHSNDSQAIVVPKDQGEDKAIDTISESTNRYTRKMTFSEHEDDSPAFKSTWQHIEGDWLHMWKERIDTKAGDGALSFRGRRLQTYAGHSSAVRDIYIPDNEHYFLSASRDKTVKLWLLKNHGNGTAQIGCGKTYDKHSKAVFAIQSIESKRFAVSCDGTVHVWDPIKSATVGRVDLGKSHSIVSIRTLPVPNTTVAMASTEGTIRLYDVRQKSICDEWKLVSNSAAGTVKCLCTNENGTWIAAGFSNGFISVLDLRTGILRGQWRAHEADILQIEAYNDRNFLSTSNDLRMKMWNEDGSLAFRVKCPPEPIHCLSLCKDQCIWATTNGNKIGITHHVSNWANYDSKKLPQDLFKGAISKLKRCKCTEYCFRGARVLAHRLILKP